MGRAVFPLLFDLRPNYGGGNEENGNLLQKVPCTQCHTLSPALQLATADPGIQPRLLDTPRQVWVSLTWTHCSFLLGSGHTTFYFCVLQESVSPVLCKFWRLYSGVDGDHLQEGLCSTQVCCTQSPCPCGRPLLTCTSPEDKHSKAGLVQSLWGLQVCTVFTQDGWKLTNEAFVSKSEKKKNEVKQNKAENPPCLHHIGCDTLLTGAF